MNDFAKLIFFILYKWLIDIIREDVITILIQLIKEDSEDIKKNKINFEKQLFLFYINGLYLCSYKIR